MEKIRFTVLCVTFVVILFVHEGYGIKCYDEALGTSRIADDCVFCMKTVANAGIQSVTIRSCAATCTPLSFQGSSISCCQDRDFCDGSAPPAAATPRPAVVVTPPPGGSKSDVTPPPGGSSPNDAADRRCCHNLLAATLSVLLVIGFKSYN